MNDAGIEVSLFIAPDEKQIEASARVGSQFVELHTGQFAEEFHRWGESLSSPKMKKLRKSSGSTESRPTDLPELERLIDGAKRAHTFGLKVNAGHGLNYENLPALCRVPHLVELNIGHSIISRAVFVGMKQAVRDMLALMKQYRG
jgi:pyridoxine 5-phosphate synthase